MHNVIKKVLEYCYRWDVTFILMKLPSTTSHKRDKVLTTRNLIRCYPCIKEQWWVM